MYGLISLTESRALLGLRPADVALTVDDLTLQVGLVDGVELDDAESADAGGGEVHQRRRAEPARADAQHAGVLESLLPGHADVGDDQVAAVAAHLVDGQSLGWFDQRRQGHVRLLGLTARAGPTLPCRCRFPASGPLATSRARPRQ